jgi:hypothetical protein
VIGILRNEIQVREDKDEKECRSTHEKGSGAGKNVPGVNGFIGA